MESAVKRNGAGRERLNILPPVSERLQTEQKGKNMPYHLEKKVRDNPFRQHKLRFPGLSHA